MLPNCNLPSDVLVMILLKLPAKPVLRCKAVCKSWYAFLSGHQFTRMHLRLHSTKRLILHSNPPDRRFLSIWADNGKRDGLVLPFDFDYKLCLQDSCNGLVCLSIDQDHRPFGPYQLILWNPTTRKHRAIDLPHVVSCDGIIYTGLGFVPDIDDYKIIWIPSKISCKMNVWVYSLRSESWKNIGILPFEYYLWPPTSTNGCIHWITCNQPSKERILAIDLCSDRFRHLELPFGFCSSIDNSIALAVINGSLSAVVSLEYDSIMNRQYEVWVMAEYGVEDSWTKSCVVGPFSYFSRPVGSWGDSKLLFWDIHFNGVVLLSYDLYTKVRDFVHLGATLPLNYNASLESVDDRRILAPENAAP